MTTISLPKIKEMVEKYKDIKLSVESLDEQHAEKTSALRAELAHLKQEIVNSFSKTGLPSIRTSDDYLCSYRKETEVVITNEVFAYKWALKNQAMRIDRLIAAKIVKEMKEVPEGFKKVDRETILLTKKNAKNKE